MNGKISLYIRICIGMMILFSISMMFYSKIILKDYEIFENEDGPVLEE